MQECSDASTFAERSNDDEHLWNMNNAPKRQTEHERKSIPIHYAMKFVSLPAPGQAIID